MERSYRCLVCDDHPILDGKLRAHVHCTRMHAHMLVSHHVDELLEELPQQLTIYDAIPEATEEVWVCRRCAAIRNDENTMKGHVVAQHVRYGYDPLRFVDYYEEGERLRCEAQGDAFARRLESVRGATDFLTECDS